MNLPTHFCRLDPTRVRLPAWPGRWGEGAHTREFEALIRSVGHTGGNIQPVYVALLPTQDDELEHFLILGRRRLLACREAGQPLFALTTSAMSPQEQFAAAVHENCMTTNRLADFELGRMCVSAIDLGLFRSVADLARSNGLPIAYVGGAVLLGRLADEIVDIFPDPRRLHVDWAMPLADMYRFDRDEFLERGERCKASPRPLTARQIFEALVHPAFREKA